MVNKRNWAAPGFTVLALLALSACAGGGGGGNGGGGGTSTAPSTAAGSGGGGGTPPPPDFEVPNIYAAYDDEQPNELDKLLVFGDSYSDTERFDFDIWSEKLTDGIDGSTIESYAKGGAFAGPTNNYPGQDGNTIETQVDNWLATTPSFSGSDLTVFYAGYNDINVPKAEGEAISNQTALDRSADHLEDQIDRVIAQGAIDGDRRIFVTRVHEWTDTPKENVKDDNFKAGFTDFWNGRIDDIANSNDNIVAVDLNTVFRRIHDDPGAYGFTNVTTADPGNAGPGGTALYHDTVHFGERGQEIIAEVYNH
ncbi:MAG: SGNH/GDSL hydrolase family protein, partial [Pseudomonadota bacterium]